MKIKAYHLVYSALYIVVSLQAMINPEASSLRNSYLGLGNLLINSTNGDAASFYKGIEMLEKCTALGPNNESDDEEAYEKAACSLPGLLLDWVLYDPNFLDQNIQRIDDVLCHPEDTHNMMEHYPAFKALDAFLAERKSDPIDKLLALTQVKEDIERWLQINDQGQSEPLDEMHMKIMLATLLKNGSAGDRSRARQLFNEARTLGNEEVEDEINTELHETIPAPNGLQHLQRRLGTHEPHYPGPMSPIMRDIRRLNYLQQEIRKGLTSFSVS